MTDKAKIAMVVGSRSDFKFFVPVLEKMKTMEIEYEFNIASAHRTPERLQKWLNEMEQAGIEVIIAGAGGAAHLPGVVASHTLLPVIGVPIDSTHLRGVDALYSIVQMPKGIPVATVGINNVENAMVLALHILALEHSFFRTKLEEYRKGWTPRIEGHMNDLRSDYPELLKAAEHENQGEKKRAKHSKQPVKKSFPSHAELTAEQDSRILADLERGFEEFSKKIQETRPQQECGTTKEQDTEKPPPRDVPEHTPERILTPGGTEERAEPAVQPGQKPRIFRINIKEPEPELIEEASLVLLEGGIVAFPTDTVYGIGVDATNSTAVRTLYEVKERDPARPLPVLIHSLRQLSSLARNIPADIMQVLDTLWPGAITIVFEKYPNTFTEVSKENTIGIRIPDNTVCMDVLSMMGRPMATTSANLSGKSPARGAEGVLEYFGERIDLVLDAGPLTSEVVSTVLDVTREPYTITREGAVTRSQLQELLGAERVE